MGRPVVLSNGQMFVGLDEQGLVHDFYYPYVGLENLTTARSTQHKIGVFVDKTFTWTDDGSWEISTDFEPDALISSITLKHKKLQLTLVLQDTIDSDRNIFIRKVHIENRAAKKREVRLFMHQVFQLSNGGRSDTALYVPEGNYILDYKGRFCLAIGGQTMDGVSFDQYAIGNYGIEGKQGTFVDAEDGQLSGNPVEHGGVDSVIRFSLQILPQSSAVVHYWIAAASSQRDAEAMHDSLLKTETVDEVFARTRSFWQEWLNLDEIDLSPVPEPERLVIQKSLLIIKAHCDSRGSILASGDSSIFNYGRDYYCYCWPRDAAYALWPLIRTGHFEEAKRFFAFARDVMHPDGYMMHKYQPDRAIGSTWHPLIHNQRKELAIQEDETAILLFMLNELLEASEDREFIASLFDSFVVPCANFLASYIDSQTGLPHASYDLWEQQFGTYTYTVSTVIAGLESAASIAQALEDPDYGQTWLAKARAIRNKLDSLLHKDGYFVKSISLENTQVSTDTSLDIASMYGPFMFAKLPMQDARLQATVKQVEKTLYKRGPTGGVIRYDGDDYFLSKTQYGGNPWIVCSMWLAQYYISAGRSTEARTLLDWTLSRQTVSGVLHEQYDPEDGTALGVGPLVWSHAELVNTLLDYYSR